MLFRGRKPEPPAAARCGILGVGTVELRGSEIVVDDWQFHTPEGAPGVSRVEDAQAGLVAGWPIAELHLISHGHPCDCPVAVALGE